MSTFLELSLILVLAAVVSGILKALKQPVIIGYILTGFILGPHVFGLFDATSPTLSTFSQMGIAILLFIEGLHLNPKELKHYGKATVFIGLGQIVITAFLGFLLSFRLGFDTMTCLYLSMILTFSSTIIVVKLLSDKKDLENLYGKISIGVLLLQDLVAAILLIAISGFFQKQSGILLILEMLLKGGALVLILSIFSFYVLPRLSLFFAKAQEYLFIFSLAWGFGIAALFELMGFSVEIGALVAGVVLSVTPYSQEIGSKLKSLRDFFVLAFFIVLGSQMNFGVFRELLIPFFVFLFFIILVKPLVIMFLVKMFNYSKSTGFHAGTSMSQISEFSLILAMIGLSVGHLTQNLVSLITILCMVSIFISTYLINYSKEIYAKISKYLGFFDPEKTIESQLEKLGFYDVILFGCNRTGYDFIKMFRDLREGFLAVDFNPEVVSALQTAGVSSMYGDAEDEGFLEDLHLEKARVVVSTIPDYEVSCNILRKIRKDNEKTIVILISYDLDEALKFYELGATYVILPHFLGGEFAASLTHGADFDIKKLHTRRNKHIDYLKERRFLGHSHPVWQHHS